MPWVIGVRVVASSARKNACGAGSAGLEAIQGETACDEASTGVWLSRFTTFEKAESVHV